MYSVLAAAGRAVLSLWLCLGLVGCDFQQAEQKPEIGMDFYEVIPENITEVLFSAGDYKIYAYRWNTDQSFHLITATPSNAAAEQCVSGKGFSNWLAMLSKAKVTQEITSHFVESGPGWAFVQLRDTSGLEPINVQLRIPASNKEPVVIQVGSGQFAVEMDGEILRRAKTGCHELSR